jgi:hypothetical protein
LRVGEFTADKKSECGSHIIQFEDFSFVNSRDSTDLHLNIRSSYKTKAPFATQNKIGSDLRKIHQNECITENLMIYDGYLNMFVTNGQGISNGQRYYKGRFRSHSFRIGAATEASRMGISDEVVKKCGRWSSGAFRNYIRF